MRRKLRSISLLSIMLATLLLTSTAASAQKVPKLRADEAAQHVGEVASVCGIVASAKYAVSTRGQPTFINLDKPYPNQIFTVLIWGSDRGAFGSPDVTLQGKRICVTGMIELYKGRPEIVVKKPDQIRAEGNK